MPEKELSASLVTSIAVEVREAYQAAVQETREMAETLDERSLLRARTMTFDQAGKPIEHAR